MTLPEFLLARIAEDEARTHMVRASWPGLVHPGKPRALVECEAKRQIVDSHAADHKWCGDDVNLEPGEPCNTLRTLAAIYADHPDYRDEWKR